jgi:hypothetical protein
VAQRHAPQRPPLDRAAARSSARDRREKRRIIPILIVVAPWSIFCCGAAAEYQKLLDGCEREGGAGTIKP